MRTNHYKHALTRRALAAVALLAAGLAGCSTDDGPAAPTDTGTTTDLAAFNAADVEFAQQMIPHHLQAIEMAALVPGRTGSPEIRALAGAIESAQQPEIDQLSALLDEWGEEVPGGPETDPRSEHETTGEGFHDGVGMMSAEQMAALRTAVGAAFDKAWLTMMIEHHEGAITMAQAHLEDGINAEAIDMAEAITTVQESEIGEMQRLLE